MKKLLFVLATVSLITYFSCNKALPDYSGCTAKAPPVDSAALFKYAGDSIPLTRDTSGMYYRIIDSGNSTKPKSSSVVTVDYVGRLMSNVIFDSASNSDLGGIELYRLIPGWQIGLPKIGVGGHIQLFIPSYYAWGCTGNGLPAGDSRYVPGDAPVFFDVRLLSVK